MQVQGLGSRQGCVPGFPFARVIDDWAAREMESIAKATGFDVETLTQTFNVLKNHPYQHPMTVLAERLSMDIDNLRKLRKGKRPWIGFDLADKIVAVCTDGFGWWNDHELRTIYEHFDFEWLDRKRPCVEAA